MIMSYMAVHTSSSEISELSRDVEQFRRFNRTYTKFVGSLNETLLESDFSLPEARVLYEVATQPGCRASEIAQTLGMDAGYLSRVLRKFEHKTLLRRKPSQDDARSAELSLTPKGKSNFVALNGRSNEQARSFLLKLPPAQRSQVMISMRNIETALTGTDCKS
jgi:DNA-binding MarR family transcriptional regulator